MKKTVIVLLLIAIGIGAYMYWGRNGEKEPVRSKVTSGSALEQKVLSFSIDGRSSNGVNQWHLEGNSAEILDDAIHLNDIKAVAYGEDVKIDLTSDKGIYRKNKGEVELLGNVFVKSDNGVVLTTEKAVWSQDTKEISTDALVNINNETMSAVGVGGKANSEDRTAVLEKYVTVKIQPDTEVRSDGPMEVSYGDNVAVFHDNVRVEDKDGKLFADKLTVEFDPESRQLKQVTAEGNVKLKKGNSYTISEKAIYTESTKSAKLLGRPRIVIDPEEISQLEKTGNLDMMKVTPQSSDTTDDLGTYTSQQQEN